MHSAQSTLLKIVSAFILSLLSIFCHADNTAPQLLPIEDETIMLGQTVVIQPVATDAEQDSLQFTLRYAPPSAKINSQTGLFSWQPKSLGQFKIAIVVTETNHDSENLRAQSTFKITVVSKKLAEFDVPPDIEQIDSILVQTLPADAFTTFSDVDVQKLPPATFKTILPQQFAQFTAQAICGLTAEQFQSLPVEHLGYISARSMTGFTPSIIRLFRKNHLDMLNKQEIKRIPSITISSILTNLQADYVLPEHVTHLLPENWDIDIETGKLSAPPGARLTFKALHLDKNLSDKTQLPYDIPDLNSHFAFAGETDETVLSDLNEVLAQNQLSHLQLSQNAEGIVSVHGLQNGINIEYAMMPDSRHIIQKPAHEKSGLNVNNKNGLRLVTAQKQSFSMLPAPKNLAALEKIIGEKGKIKIDDNGEVLLRYFDTQSQTYRRSFVMFDYIVQKTTNQRARIELPKRSNERTIREGRVVYDDGSSQNIYPTVLYPETLISLLYAVSGVEQVIYNVDGSFSVNLSGANYNLLPLDGFTSQQIDAGQTVNPSISLSTENVLDYTVQDNAQLLTFNLLISA
jgi:hypothetical protein